jgi:hypothetical protein
MWLWLDGFCHVAAVGVGATLQNEAAGQALVFHGLLCMMHCDVTWLAVAGSNVAP